MRGPCTLLQDTATTINKDYTLSSILDCLLKMCYIYFEIKLEKRGGKCQKCFNLVVKKETFFNLTCLFYFILFFNLTCLYYHHNLNLMARMEGLVWCGNTKGILSIKQDF